MDKDILDVENKRDDQVYYWASLNKRSPQYFKRMEYEGYELVRPEDREKPTFADVVENSYQLDDLVLMRRSKEKHAKALAEEERRIMGIVEHNEAAMRQIGAGIDGVENVSTIGGPEPEAFMPTTETVRPKEATAKSFYFPENPLAKRPRGRPPKQPKGGEEQCGDAT